MDNLSALAALAGFILVGMILVQFVLRRQRRRGDGSDSADTAWYGDGSDGDGGSD